LKVASREHKSLDTMAAQLDKLPDDEGEFIMQQQTAADSAKYLPAEYGL